MSLKKIFDDLLTGSFLLGLIFLAGYAGSRASSSSDFDLCVKQKVILASAASTFDDELVGQSPKMPSAFAASPAAVRGGAAKARSAGASYVPVTRKVTLTDEKEREKGGVQS